MFNRLLSAAIAAAFVTLTAAPTSAQENAGSYLAGRQAGFGSDFSAAARFYTEAMLADPSNPALLERAMTAYVALGQIDAAIPIAKAMGDYGIESQIANLVLDANAVRTGDWAHIFEALERGRTVGPLVDGLSQAWAHVGEGEVTKALMSFDEVIASPGLQAYGLYHKAMALALVGDYEGADAIFALAPDGGLRHNRRSAIAHVQVLSQLERNDDALVLIDTIFGTELDPLLANLRAQIEEGAQVPFDIIQKPEEGVAEIYYAIAETLRGETPDGYTLLYARAAEYLRPDSTEVVLLIADLLDDIGRYELANLAFAKVSKDDPAFPAAELGRAEALRKAGNVDGSIEVLTALSRSHSDLPQVFSTLGDTYRQMERLQDANDAYTKALALYPEANPARWFVFYTRAITFHALDNWPSAEADFRAALAIRPGHPQVLNYLGYSLVERGEKMDEALAMIEEAVATQPENGAIVDSLGWVQFQMGLYEESVVHMERAASLEAVDPVVNDHLGDVYWAVGRKIEARFQWHRALSFKPEEEEAERIRRKIEIGLDAVLLEEGAEPLRVANEKP